VPAEGRLRTLAIAATLALAAFIALKLLPAGRDAQGRAAVTLPPAKKILEPGHRAGALVHVAGAVRHPGVYRVGADARVRDAVRRAGGARNGADLDAVNLAARLRDGQQVVVPARNPTGSAAGAAGKAPVSLGSASAEELDTLEGIGPVMARKIVEWRTGNGGVGSVEELDQVPGIGPKTVESLRRQLAP